MKLLDKIIKKEIKSLTRIQDFFDQRYEYLRLDKNERLLPFSQKDLAQFKKKINSESLSGYGELGAAYRALARALKVKTDQLLLASGSDLAIKSVYEACVERGDNVVLHLPSYAMYRVYANMFGAQVRGVLVKNDWCPDIDAMLKLVDNKTKFMCLESPNGFVGTNVDIKDIKRCAAYLAKKNVLLMIDESYHYVENQRSQVIDLIKQFSNLIITQTLSKGHGLAGVRVGYLIGDPEVISFIARVRPMHEVTSLTALAVEWVLENPHMVAEFQRSIKESKKYLIESLTALGIEHKDTHGNFMLLYLPESGVTRDMVSKLKDKKILVRRPFEESFLKGWTRICIGSLKDSKIFISTLKKLL